MGAKTTKGQQLDVVIENEKGESRLNTGIIYNASDYVVQYYISKAYIKQESVKPPTIYSEKQSDQHQISHQEYSEEWDDWQKSQPPRSKNSEPKPSKNGQKTSSQKSQDIVAEQNQPTIGYKYILVSIPRGQIKVKGLSGLMMGKSKLSICLRKPNEYIYLKDQEIIAHFADICLEVNNQECIKMTKEQINNLIGQLMPQMSPIKRFDDEEASQSAKSGRTNTSKPRKDNLR